MIYPASTQRDVFEHKDSLETCKPVLLDSSEPCFFLEREKVFVAVLELWSKKFMFKFEKCI